MITEDYVSFENAKLLKEKGFNIPYDSFRGVYINGEILRRDPGQTYLCNDGDEVIEVCSLQLAMKWLREIHNIHITMAVENNGNYIGYLYRTNGANIQGWDRRLSKTSYEEACEAAIKYCLENLI